jgi:UDP-GlcNAc3NAcA epimerase
MRVLTVIGARPQFVKAAAISRLLKHEKEHSELIVHTGQHYDVNMSDVFFQQLHIPKPNFNLNVSGLGHGAMTGRMMEGLEQILKESGGFDWLLVYGDTNSTLAGALVAAKYNLPIAHVEAGLRSHNMSMPEEINRIVTDRLSSLLLCPTTTAVDNLHTEGFPFTSVKKQEQRVCNVGDVMYDAVLYYKELSLKHCDLSEWDVTPQNYILCTVHRQENTDDKHRMVEILSAISLLSEKMPVLLPLHPRTAKKIEEYGLSNLLSGTKIIQPLPYLEMQRLLMDSHLLITDSGGMQKEAFFYGVPCITMRDETEWVETVHLGWNKLTGASREAIRDAYEAIQFLPSVEEAPYGDGTAAKKIIAEMSNYLM